MYNLLSILTSTTKCFQSAFLTLKKTLKIAKSSRYFFFIICNIFGLTKITFILQL